MIQKRSVVAMVAILVIATASSVATSQQTADPFHPAAAAGAGSVVESTSTSATPTRRPGPAHEQILNAETERKLATTMVEAMFYPQIPFSEVVLDFQHKYGIQILVHDSALDDELDHGTILETDLRNVSLEQALELLLVKHNATYLVRSGVVQVISKDVEGDPENFETRIFDCEAIVKALPGSIPGLTPVPAANDKEPAKVDSRSTLEKLVQENVGMDSWLGSGTGDAVVRELNGKLLVRNSGQNLRETRRFLEYMNSKFVVIQ